MGRQWNDEQKLAINAESGSLLVSAAAGSGKTSVLVERIARKLTDEVDACAPDELLVVTFTNAAAAEMRGRVFQRITEMSTECPDRRREFSNLLPRLGEMRICTMDSFCIGFVREHFHVCGIESDFRILDNGENEILKKQTADEVIEKMYSEDEAGFIPLSGLFEKGRSDALLADSIIKLSDFSKSEPDPDKWLDGIADCFSSGEPENSVFGKIITAEILEGLDYCMALTDGAICDVSSDEQLYAKLAPVFSNDLTLYSQMRERFENYSWDERTARLEELSDSISAKRLTAPKGYTDEPHKLAAAAKRKECKEVIKKLVEKLCVSTAEHEEDIVFLEPIVKEFIKTVKTYDNALIGKKRYMNAYDFSDVLHFALSLLSDSDSPDGKTPLAREMSASLKEIMIDEYQDTNRAQEYLFTALSDNGENLFTVGDVKQSIYRFRLASPELFLEKCDSYPYYDGVSKKSKIILGRNYRSRKGIIEGVNFIFSVLMSRSCGEISYDKDEKLYFGAEYYPENNSAALEVDYLADENYHGIEAEAKYIAAEIKNSLSAGVEVYSGNGMRKAVPGDFCILTRDSKGTSQVIASELRKAGLSVAMESGESFFDTAELKMILSLLRVVDNPARDVDLLAAMLSPVFGFSVDEAAEIRLNFAGKKKRGSLYSAVISCANDGNEKCNRLKKCLDYYKKKSAVLPVYELIEYILTDTSFYYICSAMSGGELRKANIRRLLEYVHSFKGDGMNTLSGFIRYIDRVIESGKDIGGATLPADGNSVRVMTMHKSKGLEFPFVFIAGTCKKFNRNDINGALILSHKYGIGLKRQEKEKIKVYETLSFSALKSEYIFASMSEEMRILYVAATRAREKLYIVIAPDNGEKALSDISGILSGVEKIPPYYLKHCISPSKWLVAAFLRHPDADMLRRGELYIEKTDSRADFRLIKEIPEADSDEENPGESPEENVQLTELIRSRASYRYEYADVASVLSKHSASKINEEVFKPEYFARSAPAFISSEGLTPADIGTATHRFLQFCDFEKCISSPSSELERLTRCGRLSDAEAAAVDTEAVKVFACSDIMKRYFNAEKTYRERQFTIAESICDMDSCISEKYRNEKTVVIGKTDMIFIEDGKAVIVDYKTDKVSDVSELKKRYSAQLELYSKAVSRSLDVEISECVLYSLTLKQFCKI